VCAFVCVSALQSDNIKGRRPFGRYMVIVPKYF
jgi:hypothetical protein